MEYYAGKFIQILQVTSIVVLLIGCSSQHKSQSQLKDLPMEKLNITKGENAENKILFITFRMALTDSMKDTYKFTVINTIFAEGILDKNSFNSDIVAESYNLYCEILDENKKRLDLLKVQNPLLKVFEYSSDKKTLEKKLFTTNTGELYLRFQFTKNSKYIAIYKPQPDFRILKKIYYAQI